jgi:hypothetical protein
MNKITQLLENGEVTIDDLAQAVNDQRPMALSPLVITEECFSCHKRFIILPQDSSRARVKEERFCCWKKQCRINLKNAQKDARKARKEETKEQTQP